MIRTFAVKSVWICLAAAVAPSSATFAQSATDAAKERIRVCAQLPILERVECLEKISREVVLPALPAQTAVGSTTSSPATSGTAPSGPGPTLGSAASSSAGPDTPMPAPLVLPSIAASSPQAPGSAARIEVPAPAAPGAAAPPAAPSATPTPSAAASNAAVPVAPSSVTPSPAPSTLATASPIDSSAPGSPLPPPEPALPPPSLPVPAVPAAAASPAAPVERAPPARGWTGSAADLAFNPAGQAVYVQGVTTQRPPIAPLSSVPITAGPTVPIVNLDDAKLSAVPGKRWQVVLHLQNNSAGEVVPVINCRFTNGDKPVEQTNALVPTIGPGVRVGMTINGPTTDLFVDRANCRVTSP